MKSDELVRNYLKTMDNLLDIFTEDIHEWTSEKILEELTNLEIILETEEGKNCYLTDTFISMSEILKDECIIRLREFTKGEQ